MKLNWRPLCLIFYSTKLNPKNDGETRGPLVWIRLARRSDSALREHEFVHVRQFWRTMGLHGLLYLVSPNYRFRCEAEAYAASAQHNKNLIPTYAAYLEKRYNLDKSYVDCVNMITYYWDQRYGG